MSSIRWMLEIGLPSIREVNRVVDVPVLAEIKWDEVENVSKNNRTDRQFPTSFIPISKNTEKPKN